MAVKKAASKLAADFSSLRNADLGYLCGAIGLAKSGQKAALVDRLNNGLFQERITWTNNTARILSIDMGIRNLAYCIVDVKLEAQRQSLVSLKLTKWQRIDLTQLESQSAVAVDESPATLPGSEEGTASKKKAAPDTDIFYPPALATRAYDLLKNYLLPHDPTLILIERQRFRQSGGSAVQEWTIRVNMLESMLWAALETLKREASDSNKANGFDAYAVAPKAVAQFWIQKPSTGDLPDEDNARPVKRPAKVDKKDKIDLVQKWFTPEKSDSMCSALMTGNRRTSITFSPQTELIREAFCADPRSRRKRKGQSEDEEALIDMKKRDDLADCFLQAAAWVTWEQNRRKVLDSWKRNGPTTTTLDAIRNMT